jgi:CRISPR-associated protein Cas2
MRGLIGMPRTLHLVAYDVASPRRLRRALFVVRAYASGGQKSVHECFLAGVEPRRLHGALRRVLDVRADSAVLLRLDPRARARCLGIARPPADGRFLYLG